MACEALVVTHGGGITTLSLNRPEALNPPTLRMLDALAGGLAWESGTRDAIGDSAERLAEFLAR